MAPRGLSLSNPTPRDVPDLVSLARASRGLHRPWVYLPQTAEAWRRHLARRRGRAHVSYLLRRRDTRELVGVVNLTEIVRGVFQSAYLSFYTHAAHAGQGFMSEGLRAILSRAFAVHRLHRVEANIQPANRASRRLVRRLGFRREGFSPRYLKIGGRWCDHERWALTREAWQEDRREPARLGPVQPAGMELVDLAGQPKRAREQAAALLVEGFDEPGGWPDLARAREEVGRVVAEGFARAMIEGDSVVGWVGGLPEYEGRVWELHPLVVRRQRRRRGIGRALVAAFEAEAARRGALTVTLGTDDDSSMTSLAGADLYADLPRRIAELRDLGRCHPFLFYRKLGYTVTGVVPDANGRGRPDIFMSKRVEVPSKSLLERSRRVRPAPAPPSPERRHGSARTPVIQDVATEIGGEPGAAR